MLYIVLMSRPQQSPIHLATNCFIQAFLGLLRLLSSILVQKYKSLSANLRRFVFGLPYPSHIAYFRFLL